MSTLDESCRPASGVPDGVAPTARTPSVVVLLTAAVTPNVDIQVAVTDPAGRAASYRTALRAWSDFARTAGVELAVVETTGADRSTLWPPNCPGTYIPVRAADELLPLGKGAVEAAAVDEAIMRCGWSDDTTLYKCTGRIRVANPERLVHRLDRGTVRLRRRLDWEWVDTRIIGADVGTWRGRFSGMGTEVDDSVGRYLEHVTASRVLAGIAAGEIRTQRFPRRPEFVGVSGSTGRSYHTPRLRMQSAVLRPLEAFLAGPAARRTL